MRDHEQRARVRHEQVLEQVQRLEVEVVRGLVEHEHVARSRQHARQLQAIALAARELGDGPADLLVGEQEVAQVAVHVPLPVAQHDHLAALGNVLADAQRGVERLVQL